jgi:hypothetical protein
MTDPNEPLEYTDEEKQIIAAGDDFLQLKRHTGFIRLMQTLKDWELVALSDMRRLTAPTPDQSQSALLKWAERSQLISAIEMLIENTITSGKELKGEIE